MLKRNRGETGTPEKGQGGRKRASRASSLGTEHAESERRWDGDDGDVDPDGGPVETTE